MYLCPHCATTLSRHRGEDGWFKYCEQCQGRAVTLPVLRKSVLRPFINSLWHQALERKGHGRLPCPTCDARMHPIRTPEHAAIHELDVCTRCHLIWFDEGEHEALPKEPPKPGEKPMSPKARAALAIAEVQRLGAQRDREEMTPESVITSLPAIFGLPVRKYTYWPERVPIVTWGLALFMVLVFVMIERSGDLASAIRAWGLIPAELGRNGGMTLISHIFLHGGWWHLISNAYFLMLFSDEVEDSLGWPRALTLFFACAWAGALAHVLLDPASTVPAIGASAGISGIITFYSFRFPHTKLSVLVRSWFHYRWVSLPAWAALLIWFLLQAVGLYEQWTGVSNVSAMAHLGGAVMGYLFWLRWKDLQ